MRKQCKTSRNVKNQGNKTSPKDHSNLEVIKSKDVEICNLPGKEFRVAALWKLSEL